MWRWRFLIPKKRSWSLPTAICKFEWRCSTGFNVSGTLSASLGLMARFARNIMDALTGRNHQVSQLLTWGNCTDNSWATQSNSPVVVSGDINWWMSESNSCRRSGGTSDSVRLIRKTEPNLVYKRWNQASCVNEGTYSFEDGYLWTMECPQVCEHWNLDNNGSVQP